MTMGAFLNLLVLAQALTSWQSVAAQPARQGRLTIIVRDGHGTFLPSIRVALYHDRDDGRVEVGEQRTDRSGRIVYPALAWGLYIVQFRGALSNGQAILPADRQNLGLLDDGSSAGNGFGVRLATAARTELFVLTTVPGEPDAVPMFDLAAAPNQPPRPVDPLLAVATPERTTGARQSSAPALPAGAHGDRLSAARPAARRVGLVVLGAFIVGLSGLLLLGWVRAHAATRKERA